MNLLMKKLATVQGKLKAPKNQRNNFGNYNYRSAEDILEAVKPLAIESGLVVQVSDDIIMIGDRIYVKATVKVTDIESNESTSVSAFAREELTKKGMDSSQVTGAASSYARKYALNGMFAIDDTKDSDATNDHGNAKPIEQKKTITAQSLLSQKKPASKGKTEAWKAYKELPDISVMSADEQKANFAKFCVTSTGKDVKDITEDDWNNIISDIDVMKAM